MSGFGSANPVGKQSMIGIHYTTNGTGRDSYIYGNNGGFTSSNSPNVYEPAGNMKVFTKRRETVRQIAAKPMHYK